MEGVVAKSQVIRELRTLLVGVGMEVFSNGTCVDLLVWFWMFPTWILSMQGTIFFDV